MRGGRRDNAGRKASGRATVSLRLNKETRKILSSMRAKGIDVNEIVEKAIARADKKKERAENSTPPDHETSI